MVSIDLLFFWASALLSERPMLINEKKKAEYGPAIEWDHLHNGNISHIPLQARKSYSVIVLYQTNFLDWINYFVVMFNARCILLGLNSFIVWARPALPNGAQSPMIIFAPSVLGADPINTPPAN